MKKALLIGLALLIGQWSSAQERTVKTDKSFRVHSNAWVDVIGKYGDIHIDTHDGSRVDVDVSVRVRAKSMSDVDKMLDKIKVSITGNEDRVSVRSGMDDIAQWNSHSNGKIRIVFKDGTKVNLEEFAIDYKLSIPTRNSVKLNNKYGNIYMDDLEGDADIELKYGNLETESLNGKTSLVLGYGKARMEDVYWGDFEIKYSELKMEEAQALRLDSRYSNFEVEKADTLLSESRYNGYELGEIGYLIAVERNSEMSVEELSEFGSFEMRYGKLYIEELKRDFETLSFDGQYTDCVVNVEDGGGYELDIATKYGNIRYPSNTKVRRDIRDHSSKRIEGTVGRASRSRINIRSEYGDVTIN